MSLTIDLSKPVEARLEQEARKEGVTIQELVYRTLAERFPAEMDPTLALFAQWAEEDSRMTPEERAEAQHDFEGFKQSINAERERAGARLVYKKS